MSSLPRSQDADPAEASHSAPQPAIPETGEGDASDSVRVAFQSLQDRQLNQTPRQLEDDDPFSDFGDDL